MPLAQQLGGLAPQNQIVRVLGFKLKCFSVITPSAKIVDLSVAFDQHLTMYMNSANSQPWWPRFRPIM